MATPRKYFFLINLNMILKFYHKNRRINLLRKSKQSQKRTLEQNKIVKTAKYGVTAVKNQRTDKIYHRYPQLKLVSNNNLNLWTNAEIIIDQKSID